ncbi:helix-turn-helix domain-containing protein [Streptomyces sp. NBC_00467]|uniref:helix-turn-helix domain-containing protein n=1 Tax=Streptomyces sp. NBC_00467 TaxID=2975752 RepID=UPI003FA752ED
MGTQQVSAPSRASSRVHGRVTAFGVIHVNAVHTSRFTVIGNHLAQHGELSLTAIGLAVHIQSLPEGAKVGIKVLAERFPESEARIAAALRELEEYAYLERRRERVPGGKVVTRTISYNRPGAVPKPPGMPAPQVAPGRPAVAALPLPAPKPTSAPAPKPTSAPAPAQPPARPDAPPELTPPPRPRTEHRRLRPRCSLSRRSPTWSGTALPPTSSPGSAGTSPGRFWSSATSAAWRPQSPPGSNATPTPTTYATPSPPTCPSL